ncbi:segregation/condensation protein A [Candidatus Woesearchaeota archaeon]|nr:segregation/condensation protein A [Candidatus Woesearchaeota archaeon]
MEQKIIDPHERIFNIIFSKADEITWQSIIFDLVKTEQMDPWDIDVSILTQKYIEMLRTLKEHDFRVSGKVVLAAAILLKLKSNKLVGDDLSELDRLLMGVEEEMEELGFEETGQREKLGEIPALIPRTPQPRKRKVSIFDLVDALERALEVKKRRLLHSIPPMNLEAPKKKKDITEIIREVYGRIKAFFYSALQGKLTFAKLLPSESRDDKVHTFIPLLHLAQQNKIELVQETPFGEIEVVLKKKEGSPQAELKPSQN